MTKFQFNDGGRSAAGFKGEAGDCATRAIAIATGMEYGEVYNLVNEFCKDEKTSKTRRGISSARTGVHTVTMRKIMAHLNFKWTPTMKIGQGCKVHVADMGPGTYVLSLSRHFATIVDGVLQDNHDSSRGGNRCVYGYWHKD